MGSDFGKSVKRPRLEYLQLSLQKPKPLPTFEPLIEDDFSLNDQERKLKKREKMNDPKEIKRKTKAAEKDAVRELKKDTAAIMNEKRNQAFQKSSISRKKIFSGGNMPKDEV